MLGQVRGQEAAPVVQEAAQLLSERAAVTNTPAATWATIAGAHVERQVERSLENPRLQIGPQEIVNGAIGHAHVDLSAVAADRNAAVPVGRTAVPEDTPAAGAES